MLASGNHYESWTEIKSCLSSLTFTTIKDPTIWQPQISSKVQRRSNEHLSLQVLPFLGVGLIDPVLETEWDNEIKILLKRKHWHVQEMSSSFSFQSGHFHSMNIALELSFFLEAIACIFTRFLSSIDPITFRYWCPLCLRPALSINFLLLVYNWKNLVLSKQSNNQRMIKFIEFLAIIIVLSRLATSWMNQSHWNCCLFGTFLGNTVCVCVEHKHKIEQKNVNFLMLVFCWSFWDLSSRTEMVRSPGL